MTVEVRDELLRGLNVSPQRLKLEAAVGLYASEDATLGQASAIAGVSQSEFLRELGRRGICVHYGVPDLEQDLQTLNDLGRLRKQ
jgi:predicted HTH domain antitoxin